MILSLSRSNKNISMGANSALHEIISYNEMSATNITMMRTTRFAILVVLQLPTFGPNFATLRHCFCFLNQHKNCTNSDRGRCHFLNVTCYIWYPRQSPTEYGESWTPQAPVGIWVVWRGGGGGASNRLLRTSIITIVLLIEASF